MNELVVLYSELKRDLQGMKKALAKISESPTRSLTDEWCRKEECLKIMGISSRTFNRLTSSGQLPFSKVNGLVYLKIGDIERLLNENYHKQSHEIYKN